MGQKTHPIGYRLGYNYTWSSRWYAGKDYAKLLHQDIKIRKMVKARLYHAGVAKVEDLAKIRMAGSLMDYDFRMANANTNAGITNTIYARIMQTVQMQLMQAKARGDRDAVLVVLAIAGEADLGELGFQACPRRPVPPPPC